MPDDAAKTTDATARSAGDAEALSASARALPGGAAPSQRAAKIVAAETSGAAALAEGDAPADAIANAAEKLPEHALPGSFGAPGTEASPPIEGTLIGSLDADERIRQSDQRGERTLWASALLVTLLYTSLIAGHLLLNDPFSQAAQEQRERMRRGQDAPDSISVELVPDPDKAAKTTRWQDGSQAQSPTPNEQPPAPEQMASIAQPEVPEVEKQEETKETDEPRSEDTPMLLDIESLVDAAAADFKRNLDHALARKPQKQRREQQAVMAGGGMKVRGTGASGRSDAFTRSVIAALMKTRPGPFALWGNVLVSFQVTETGQLKYVHLLHSSGNSALDQAAIEAIRKARFQRPPPGLTPDERTYIIDYIFG